MSHLAAELSVSLRKKESNISPLASNMANRRALHFVFKTGNRAKTTAFYRNVLGMKYLRHEEFEEGCKAACNGPFDGKWSKSMVGYGAEDSHFVVELTYNYGLGSYKLGNDFKGLTIYSTSILSNAEKAGVPVEEVGGRKFICCPDGYRYYVVSEEPSGDPVKKVSLGCSDLQKSVDYWNKLCGMNILSQDANTALLSYDESQCSLELVNVGEKIDHGTAGGRIAFGCPRDQLPGLESDMKAANQTILTPLISLDTPGKATVEVVILADPDGHEICYVGDEAFKELSQVDPKADQLLDEAMEADKSDEWYAKKGKTKAAAT